MQSNIREGVNMNDPSAPWNERPTETPEHLAFDAYYYDEAGEWLVVEEGGAPTTQHALICGGIPMPTYADSPDLTFYVATNDERGYGCDTVGLRLDGAELSDHMTAMFGKVLAGSVAKDIAEGLMDGIHEANSSGLLDDMLGIA